MTRDDHLTSTAGEHRAGSLSGIARWLRALWAAWTCIGPSWPGPVAQAVPASDVLWALPWLGLLLGLVWTVLFAVAWRLFGEYPAGLRLVPVLVVIVADLALTGRFSMAGVRTAESLTYRDDRLLDNRRRDITAVGVFAAIVLVLAAYVTLLAIPKGVEWWPADWRHHLHWMYPRPVFRPLLLMPIWMCWSMVLAAGMGRARAQSQAGIDPRTVNEVAGDPSQESAGVSGTAGGGTQGPASRLAGQATPAQIFVGFLMAAAFTAIYASRDKNLVIGLGVALVVFLCAYIAAMAAALRWRGQNAVTILATGLAGRTAFVLCWLFVGRALHGW